ncbi:hypothetical protein BGLCM_0576 [Bifidobacterium gallicum DSM 20093 = LMG 11596]|uniref:Uncharacterized protein n=1 Tax=Bifidobacterium gallicum DSM 20093 = LMG 11596 TaxID=561180 RepID=A0A087AJP5_9BIFI|nr:hypothetical protein BGLCM_0576 [Bifidobacterium gallicum DSM 20093 = LMG 11596]
MLQEQAPHNPKAQVPCLVTAASRLAKAAPRQVLFPDKESGPEREQAQLPRLVAEHPKPLQRYPQPNHRPALDAWHLNPQQAAMTLHSWHKNASTHLLGCRIAGTSPLTQPCHSLHKMPLPVITEHHNVCNYP